MQKPKLTLIKPNNYYSTLLQDAYCGEDGETFYFLQFQYFCYILSSFENEFTDEFYKIAQDDLDHHTMLGECIVKLGGDPIYKNSKGVNFNLKDIEYLKGIKQIFTYCIELKEKSIINYKILLSKIMDKEIKNILEIILSDEQKHKEVIENMLKKYENNK